jgi:hypothetical protein
MNHHTRRRAGGDVRRNGQGSRIYAQVRGRGKSFEFSTPLVDVSDALLSLEVLLLIVVVVLGVRL